MRTQARFLCLTLALGALAAPTLSAQKPEPPVPPTSPTSPTKPMDPRTPAPPERTMEPGSLDRERTLKTDPLRVPQTALRISTAPRRSNPLLVGLPACERRNTINNRVDAYGAPASGTACVAASEPAPTTPVGELPAMSWEVVTSGGVTPIHFSISVPRNRELESRFSIELPGPNIRHERTRMEEMQDQGKPAGQVRRIVRFAGMPYSQQLPREILVVVTARDGAGTEKATDFRLYPYSPRIVGVRAPSPVARVWGGVFVDLAGLGLATALERKNPGGLVSGACRWSEIEPVDMGAVDPAPINLGQHDGSYQLSRSALLSDPEGVDNDAFQCDLLLRLRLRFPLMEDDQLEPVIVLEAPSPLSFQARQTYRLNSTWSLHTRLGLFPGNGLGDGTNLGTCSGTSVGPTENYSVGVQDHEGDLSFRIRSGPAGTECRFLDLREQALKLPNGFELVSSNWTKEYTSKCGLGQNNVEEDFDFSRNGFTVAPTALATVAGLAPTLYDPDNSGVTLRTDASPAYRTVLRPILVWLWCDKTAINDHQVRMTLTEATFTGPPGADFP
jgi:hypothetical protein